MKLKIFLFVFLSFLFWGCKFNTTKGYHYRSEKLNIALEDGDCINQEYIIDGDNNTYSELYITPNTANSISIPAKQKNISIFLTSDNPITIALCSSPIDPHRPNKELYRSYGTYFAETITTDILWEYFYINISSKENTNIKVYDFINY